MFIFKDDGLVSIPAGIGTGGGGGGGGNNSPVMMPYFIKPTDTFIIPVNFQGLYDLFIDAEGVLEIDGVLIEV